MLKIKEFRIAKNLTQKELGKIIGCNQTSIGKYERGELEPNLELLNKFADIFEVSIDYLVGREDDFGNVNVDASLSNEETELIKNFRLLDDVQRRALSRTAKSFADDNASLSKVDVKNNF